MDVVGVREWLDDRVAQHLFSGVALVWADGAPTFAYAGGIAERRHRVPITTDTRFAVASVTKVVVAATCLVLVDRGQLDLHRPLTEILPPEHRPDATDRRAHPAPPALAHLRPAELPRRRRPGLGIVHLRLGSGADLPRPPAGRPGAAVRPPAGGRPARRAVPVRRREFHPGRPGDRGGHRAAVDRDRARSGAGAGRHGRHRRPAARRRPRRPGHRLPGLGRAHRNAGAATCTRCRPAACRTAAWSPPPPTWPG